MNDDKNKAPSKVNKGGRNLVLLGIGAILITLATTLISLKIYHDSGDIYLDRSRPGFLPEKEETEHAQESADFTFSESGQLDEKTLDEYLEHLRTEIDRLNDYSDEPFDAKPLSSEVLGF